MHEFVGVHFTCIFQVNEFIIGSAMGYDAMHLKLGEIYIYIYICVCVCVCVCVCLCVSP